jgi:hypothetical protein
MSAAARLDQRERWRPPQASPGPPPLERQAGEAFAGSASTARRRERRGAIEPIREELKPCRHLDRGRVRTPIDPTRFLHVADHRWPEARRTCSASSTVGRERSPVEAGAISRAHQAARPSPDDGFRLGLLSCLDRCGFARGGQRVKAPAWPALAGSDGGIFTAAD